MILRILQMFIKNSDGYSLMARGWAQISFEVTAKVSSRDNELRSRVIMLTQSKRRWAVQRQSSHSKYTVSHCSMTGRHIKTQI